MEQDIPIAADGIQVDHAAFIGLAVNTSIWMLDTWAPQRLRAAASYPDLKRALAPALGALLGIIPGMLQQPTALDRAILGAMIGASSSLLHAATGRLRRPAAAPPPPPSEEGP